MPNSSSQSKRYAPRGDRPRLPAEFSLEPHERKEVDDWAQNQGTTRAAVLRDIHLLGIPLYRDQHPGTTQNEG